MSEGRKNDTGKLRYDLLPPDALDEVAFVYTIGATKYTDRNWEEGMKWGRIVAALERHIQAWKSGEMLDPEDGHHHLAAAAWCCLTLIAYELRGIGVDDRGVKVKLPRRKVEYAN